MLDHGVRRQPEHANTGAGGGRDCRFVLYTAYGMAAVSIWMELLSSVVLPIEDNLLAAIAAGALLGGGVGTALRSFGSTGGLDIIAVILHQRFGFRIGQIGFLFNM